MGGLDPRLPRNYALDRDPEAQPSPHPKWHLDWFSRSCRVHDRDRHTDIHTDRPTDRPRYSVFNNRSQLRSTAMRPKMERNVPRDFRNRVNIYMSVVNLFGVRFWLNANAGSWIDEISKAFRVFRIYESREPHESCVTCRVSTSFRLLQNYAARQNRQRGIKSLPKTQQCQLG